MSLTNLEDLAVGALSRLRRAAVELLDDRPSAPATIRFAPNPVPEFKLGLGFAADGEPVQVRPGNIIVACGHRVGGTNLLHNLIAQVVQTRDAVVWAGDLSGSCPAAWLYPATSGSPLIDWAGVDGGSVDRIVTAALDLAKSKERRRGLHWSLERNRDGYPTTSGDPAVYVVIDEIVEIGDSLRVKIGELMRVGPGVAIYTILRTSRATADHIPAAMKRSTTARLAGPGLDPIEYAHLLDRKDADVAQDLPSGHFLAIGHGLGSGLTRLQAPLITVADIADLTAAAGPRPVLHLEQQDILPEYAARWTHPTIVGFRNPPTTGQPAAGQSAQ